MLLRSRKEAGKPGGAGAERGPEKEAGLGPVGKEFGCILSGQERLFGEH